MYVLPPVSPPPRGLVFSDYIDSARELGCSVSTIKAVADVESLGDGFLMDGRPKILFEAHWFSKLTGHVHDTSHPNISSLTWNRRLYRGGVGEYARLQQAIALDHEAALKSTSWGKFQILGANHALCRFSTVEAFVEAHYKDENEQLDAFVSFVKSRRLVKALLTKDWNAFAKGYNGKRYKENNYHVKLDAAERKYAAKLA